MTPPPLAFIQASGRGKGGHGKGGIGSGGKGMRAIGGEVAPVAVLETLTPSPGDDPGTAPSDLLTSPVAVLGTLNKSSGNDPGEVKMSRSHKRHRDTLKEKKDDNYDRRQGHKRAAAIVKSLISFKDG
jgi:hypothetical protein